MAALEPGIAAPALRLPDAAGGSDHAPAFDSLTLLAFFKHNCPTCQLAMPYVEKFARYMSGGLELLSIAEDPSDLATAFAERYGITLPMALDTAPYEASASYGLTNVPTLFLVGPGGHILQNQVGFSRDGYNGLSAEIARRLNVPEREISAADDGAPSFKPG